MLDYLNTSKLNNFRPNTFFIISTGRLLFAFVDVEVNVATSIFYAQLSSVAFKEQFISLTFNESFS